MKKGVTASGENSGFDWRRHLPDVTYSFEEHDDVTLLTMCIWGEARGEDLPVKMAVGCTVRNRALNPRWWGRSWKEVILKPYQYSAFNHGDPNRTKMQDPLKKERDGRTWRQCLWVAWGIYYGLVEDITGGATHYHQRDMRKYPSWSEELTRTTEMGPFLFYTALPASGGPEEKP